MPSNETTTKFKVDISDLKKNITEANRHIKLANAEFKAASAGMESWEKSTDGMNAKLSHMPEESREKLSDTLGKIINEGSNGLICILL